MFVFALVLPVAPADKRCYLSKIIWLQSNSRAKLCLLPTMVNLYIKPGLAGPIADREIQSSGSFSTDLPQNY